MKLQDLPTYPGSKLDVIVKHLEPIIYNKTLCINSQASPQVQILLFSFCLAYDDEHNSLFAL